MQKKINVTIDEELLDEVDKYSKNYHMSRSGFLSLSVGKYIEAIKFQTILPEYVDLLKDLSSGSDLDDDTMEKIDDMERTVRALRRTMVIG